MTLGRLQVGRRRFDRGGRGIGEGGVKQVECTVYMHGVVRVREMAQCGVTVVCEDGW